MSTPYYTRPISPEVYRWDTATMIDPTAGTFACTVTEKRQMLKESRSRKLVIVWPGRWKTCAFEVNREHASLMLNEGWRNAEDRLFQEFRNAERGTE